MTLSELIRWVTEVPASLPEEMRPMAESICQSFLDAAKRLMDLGLGYLTLDRASSTLSTERTPADAACPGCTEPDYRSFVCTG